VVRARAALLRDPDGPYSIEEVEVGDPRAGEVRVSVVGAGHCHTDLIVRSGLVRLPLPAILGHEGAGYVDAVGPGVTSVREGDAVVLSFASCGECLSCLDGHPAQCVEFFVRNFTGARPDGTTPITTLANEPVSARWFGQSSFASCCVANATGVVRVDSALPIEVLGPLGCSVQTGAGSVMNVLRPGRGGTIAVLGTGAVGLSAVMAARLEGCETIVAVDRNQARLDLAIELGATHAVLAGPDAEDALRAAAPAGLDTALDTTAVTEVLALAANVLKPGGVLGTVGVGSGAMPELRDGRSTVAIVEGDAHPQRFIPAMIDHWLAGDLPFDRLVSTFPLDEINQAEAAALGGEVVKAVLRPTSSPDG
jgi:aryl-alcohol dehydrogenase